MRFAAVKFNLTKKKNTSLTRAIFPKNETYFRNGKVSFNAFNCNEKLC